MIYQGMEILKFLDLEETSSEVVQLAFRRNEGVLGQACLRGI